MSNVVIEPYENFAIVRMANGITNAINPDFVNDLSDAVQKVTRQFRGFILTGTDKFFSIGFDLPRLLKMDRTIMSAFLADFDALLFDIFTAPMPTICAMEGHAVGGGNILSLTCDFRYAAVKKIQIGLNEIQLGLPVPYLADLILRQLLGDREASSLLYSGKFMYMNDACTKGLVDSVFPKEIMVSEAIKKMTELAGLPSSGYAAIKENRVERIVERFKKNQDRKREQFLFHWFSKPIQEILMKASEKF